MVGTTDELAGSTPLVLSMPGPPVDGSSAGPYEAHRIADSRCPLILPCKQHMAVLNSFQPDPLFSVPCWGS